MAKILQLSDWEFNYDYYARTCNGKKVDNLQKQMDNISREMEILRKNQKEMLEIKKTLTEMKNAFDRLISRLDMAEEKSVSFNLRH